MSRSARTADQALRDDEAGALFFGLENSRGLILAVSGGADSTALLVLAARWAKRLKHPPKLVAVTIDHGLRAEAAREAAAVRRLARRLGVAHRTLRWQGRKPGTGLQEAARNARYRLLAQAAASAGYVHILTAHTMDDKAETVLFRLARGSGLVGLSGMAPVAPLPLGEDRTVFLLRPLLRVPKARLLATLQAEGIAHSEDPSNRDPRFTRVRLRSLMPDLAREGLSAPGLSRFAARMRRADGAYERITWDEAMAFVVQRLQPILERYGPHAVGIYFGNPLAFNTLGLLTMLAFMRALGTRNVFYAGTQDCQNKFAG